MKLAVEHQKQLDEQMQKGYQFLNQKDYQAAIEVWIDLWEKLKNTMQNYDYKYIEEIDRIFEGRQSIFNWATDFEMELSNASIQKYSFIQKKIDFCSEYIAKSKNKNENNIQVMKRVIAEGYFQLGDTEKGEQLFVVHTKEHPTSGWGWINWSDQYGVFAEVQNIDYERAISILEQSLKVEGLEDKPDVLDRLSELYEKQGMDQKLAEIKELSCKEEQKKLARQSFFSRTIKPSPEASVSTIQSNKVGRNDPCPCGSGKKYKKCCGK